jgi:sarcosine oxidase subunit beta
MIVAQTEEEVEFLQHKAAMYVAEGVDLRYLDRKETLALQPALANHTVGALYSPGDCLVNPLKFGLALARKARELGARIETFCSVSDIIVTGDRVSAVVTSRGEIGTENVVNAAGAWSGEIARMAGVDLPIVPRKGEVLVSEPVPPLIRGAVLSASYLLSKRMPPSWGALDGTLLAGVVTSQEVRGNLLLGSTRQFVGFDRRSTYEGMRELVRQSAELIPAYRELHIIRGYSGLRPALPDGLPIIEHSPQVAGFFIATGHAGDAIALAPITGQRITQLIAEEIDTEALASFASRRFQERSVPSESNKDAQRLSGGKRQPFPHGLTGNKRGLR